MSEDRGRCRAAIGILEACRTLIAAASTEAGGPLWSDCQRDERAILKCIERIQNRLVLRHDSAPTSTTVCKE